MCGDSTKAQDVEKLVGGELADMVYCDPPYNIGLDYDSGIGGGGDYGGSYDKKDDTKKDDEYRRFVEETVINALKFVKPDTHFFYWCDERYIGMLQDIFVRNGIQTNRVCLWIKNNSNVTPQIAFSKVYEPCVYGTIGKPYLDKKYTKYNEILNKELSTGNILHDEISDMVNLWIVPRDATSKYEHPTQKPLNLHEKPLRRCTKAGSIVMDLFGGSGSTMMACEQMGRSSVTMEVDPIFCEKIIRRWERETGEQAIYESTD
jgi:DNA modification methylase